MDTIKINDNTYEISGYADDGLPIIKATAETIDEGFDEDGNPKRSVKITVPPIELGATPGEVE